MVETQYQRRRPFVVGSTATTVAFGIKPTADRRRGHRSDLRPPELTLEPAGPGASLMTDGRPTCVAP
jgi:hypothetical protein